MSIIKRALVFLAEGFEEIEAITPIDLLRRAGFDVTTVSINENPLVMGSHNIPVKADMTIEELINKDGYDVVILPGGMKGTTNLGKSARVCEIIKSYDANPDKFVAAICAAPTVLAANGILEGKKALCYPGPDLIQKLADGGAVLRDDYHELNAIIDGHTVTGKGAGAAIDFALAIISAMETIDAADVVAGKIAYKWNKDMILGL
jgi:DJ-1 family protein